MATIKDVARVAGVGVGTASRALSGNGSVSAEAKVKVEEAAKSLGFVLNQVARNLKNSPRDALRSSSPPSCIRFSPNGILLRKRVV